MPLNGFRPAKAIQRLYPDKQIKFPNGLSLHESRSAACSATHLSCVVAAPRGASKPFKGFQRDSKRFKGFSKKDFLFFGTGRRGANVPAFRRAEDCPLQSQSPFKAI
jgi:hypothetical protein